MGDTSERLAGWIPGHDGKSGFPRGVVRGPEDIQAIEQVSPEDVLVGDTTYDCLKIIAETWPDKTAIIAMHTGDPHGPVSRINYADYLRRTTAAANLFRSTSGGKPSVVALMLPIVPDALFAAWGGCTAGVAATINPHLEPEMVAAILTQIGATALVTSQAHGRSAADRLEDIRKAVPGLTHVWLVDGDDPEMDFAKALDAQPSDHLTFKPEGDPHGTSIYLPTGGTTAAPKLARLNHRGQLLNAWTAGSIMGAREDEIVGVGMPLFHVGGLLMLSLRAMIHGQTALLLTPAGFRDPGVVLNFWEISRHLGMTSVIATPTTAAALLAAKGEFAGHNIRTMTSGGSTIPVELGRKFHETFNLHLREVWGATEFHGFLGCMPNDSPPVLGSVGLRTPFHDVRAFILEDNHFVREARPGEEGVIVGRGPGVCSGYVDPSNDASFFVTGAPEGEVWGSSGDVGRVDENGYIWIHGRAKDVIIRGGHNLDPRMIEEVLVSHPAVQLAAAVGQPDRSKGELPIAYVQLLPDHTASVEDLLQFCKQHVKERAACPVEVIIIDRMPLTAVGKIFKPDLRLDATRRVVRRVAADVVGLGRLLSIETPANAGRPIVVVQVCGSLAINEPMLAELKTALGGYHFDVTTRCEPEATANAPDPAFSLTARTF